MGDVGDSGNAMRLNLRPVITGRDVFFFESLICVVCALEIRQGLLETRRDGIEGLLRRRIAFGIGDIGTVRIDVKANRAPAPQGGLENHSPTTAKRIENDTAKFCVALDRPLYE